MKTKKRGKKETYNYEVDIYWGAEDLLWIANVPELKGCVTHGATRAIAAEMAEEAIQLYIDSMKARGIKPPIPVADLKFSGEFLVRTEPALHRDLMLKATMEKTSLNKFVERALRAAV